MPRRVASLSGAVLGLLAMSVPAQAQPDAPLSSATRYLAANCANCHGTDGRTGSPAAGMPVLAGMARGHFIDQMTAFRDGKRPATIMHQLAKGYSDEQITLLADYFAAQKGAP